MLLCSILGVKTFGAGRAGVRLRSKQQNKRNELDRKQEESFAQGRVEQRSWRPSIHTGYPDTRLCIWHNILLNCTTSFKVQNSDLFSWFLFTHSFPCLVQTFICHLAMGWGLWGGGDRKGGFCFFFSLFFFFLHLYLLYELWLRHHLHMGNLIGFSQFFPYVHLCCQNIFLI